MAHSRSFGFTDLLENCYNCLGILWQLDWKELILMKTYAQPSQTAVSSCQWLTKSPLWWWQADSNLQPSPHRQVTTDKNAERKPELAWVNSGWEETLDIISKAHWQFCNWHAWPCNSMINATRIWVIPYLRSWLNTKENLVEWSSF